VVRAHPTVPAEIIWVPRSVPRQSTHNQSIKFRLSSLMRTAGTFWPRQTRRSKKRQVQIRCDIAAVCGDDAFDAHFKSGIA
jgi:hypothetical protein